MIVLVTLSFTSVGSAIQAVGAEGESQEGLWQGGWMARGEFERWWVTTIKC